VALHLVSGFHPSDPHHRSAPDRRIWPRGPRARRAPTVLRCDNGPELACWTMSEWTWGQVGLRFIPAGEPWHNGYLESFDSRMRDECLNINSFWSLAQPHSHRRLEARLQASLAALRCGLPTSTRYAAAATTANRAAPVRGNCVNQAACSGAGARTPRVVGTAYSLAQARRLGSHFRCRAKNRTASSPANCGTPVCPPMLACSVFPGSRRRRTGRVPAAGRLFCRPTAAGHAMGS
jgi:hypothetical protein